MASVRRRVKSPKSAADQNCTRDKHKKHSTGSKHETESINSQKMIDRKKLDMLPKTLTSDEKVALLLQNGHLMKEKFVKKLPMNNGKLNKDSLSITKGQLLTKSGRLKKKTKNNFMLLDNILKTELMINEISPKSPPPKPQSNEVYHNNNYDGMSDQNKSDTDNSPYKDKKKKNKDKVPKNKEKRSKKGTKISKKTDLKQNSKTKQVTLSNGVVLTLSLFTCDYCKRTFSSKSSLRRHIYVHLDLKPYSCPQCTKRFRQRCNLQMHVYNKHASVSNVSKSTYVCNLCDKPFLLKENLTLHLTTHVKTENSFKCVYCDKTFSHHLLLTQHEKQHLVSGRFQCTICNMSYDCRSRLSLHVKSHLNIKDYMCQHCGKEFLRPNSVRRHVEICHGGYRIQCPICKKKLKGHLPEHMRTHEKKRPHECPECGQRFTQSTQLTVHRRNHTGAKPYPCRICDQPFSHSNALMLHIRRHTGEKPFQCALCPMSFSQSPHMKSHMRKIHGKNESYKCNKCLQFFKLKVQLVSHSATCKAGDKELTFEEKIEASLQVTEVEVDSPATLSRLRFLLALLLTMIASKDKLKYLGFNKRLIDDLLVESLEAMGHQPCKDMTLTPLNRLKTNIDLLLNGTVPKEKMEKLKKENKSTEDILVLLTDAKKKK